jgi:hypothetical protein
MTRELSLHNPHNGDVAGQFKHESCKPLSVNLGSAVDSFSPDPSSVLLPPRQIGTIEMSLFNKILAALATRFDTTVHNIRQHVSANRIEQWGKVRRLEGGDTMVAAALTKERSDNRDATFVRVCAVYALPVRLLT